MTIYVSVTDVANLIGFEKRQKSFCERLSATHNEKVGLFQKLRKNSEKLGIDEELGWSIVESVILRRLFF
jgi:hypothetical protein